MIEVERLYLYIPGYVSVYRHCEDCKKWLNINQFYVSKRRITHICKMCARWKKYVGRSKSPKLRQGSRSYSLTQSGKTYLRELKRRENQTVEPEALP